MPAEPRDMLGTPIVVGSLISYAVKQSTWVDVFLGFVREVRVAPSPYGRSEWRIAVEVLEPVYDNPWGGQTPTQPARTVTGFTTRRTTLTTVRTVVVIAEAAAALLRTQLDLAA